MMLMTTPMMAPVEIPVREDDDDEAGRALREADRVDEAEDVGREDERGRREAFGGRFTSALRKKE